jgi:hypothetical protein
MTVMIIVEDDQIKNAWVIRWLGYRLIIAFSKDVKREGLHGND